MARKSRKNLLQPKQATVSVQFPELDEEKIPTAIYGRLSVEDDEDNESMETQIALVQDFINRSSELNYVDTYFDNRSQNFLFSPLAEMASEAKFQAPGLYPFDERCAAEKNQVYRCKRPIAFWP
mgnify:CR=1 FL=1